MAFPTVASVTVTASGNSAGTSSALTGPAAVDAGDLLIAIVGRRSADTWTPPTGFTEIYDAGAGGTGIGGAIAYKIADGSEDGATFTFTSSGGGNIRKGGFVIRITGWHGTTPPEATGTAATSGDPNPPSETASWGGAEDNLFIAVGWGDQGAITAYPTNYGSNNNFSGETGANKWGVAMATRDLAADTDDPGVFNWTTNPTSCFAATVVVRPAAAGGGGGGSRSFGLILG